MGRRMRLAARAGVGGLVLIAGAAPDVLADETHGDVNLPALTPEEIRELGLETAPGSADTVAPGSQDVDADQIPDHQDAGAPAPEEVEAPAEAVPEAAPAPIETPAPVEAPPPAAPPAPAPVEAPAPRPVAPVTPVAEPKRPAEPRAEPRRRRATRPRPVTEPPRIGVQAQPPARYAPAAAVVTPRPLPVAQVASAEEPVRPVVSRDQRRVRAGESLWSIAAELAGPGASPARVAAEVERLWRLNRDRIRTGDPDVLPAGVELVT